MAAALSTPPGTPPPPPTSTNFDIISHYNHLISSDESLTPPIAAIESLISLLSSCQVQTVSETLSLLSTASSTLLSSQQNPLPLSAGTELFQRYLITSFNQTPLSTRSGSDFSALRNQQITNSKLFVARAKQARSKIASYALPLFGPEHETEHKSTVITYGGSRVVSEVLRHAADKGRWFNVIHIIPSSTDSESKTTNLQISSLRKLGVKIATIPLSHLNIVLNSLPTDASTRHSSTFFLLGAGAVLENGSTVSEIGTSLVAQMARIHQTPLYVATESYKFVRQFPVGYGRRDLERMGTRQTVLDFSAEGEGEVTEREFDWGTKKQELVDVTDSGMIKGLVTENGIMTPNAVAEELIKLWF